MRLKNIGLRAGSILVLLLLWWAASRAMNHPEVLPGPLPIARTIMADFGTRGPEGESAYFDVGITLLRIFIAFAASMIAGTGTAWRWVSAVSSSARSWHSSP